MKNLLKGGALCAALAIGSPALADNQYFEVWLNPTITKSVSDKTDVELETAQRFRSRGDGGRDTYFFRLWVNTKAAKGVTLSGGVEQRWNDSQQEQRLLQQVSLSAGPIRWRSRFEQRFVDGEQRMAVRFRQRLGLKQTVSKDEKLSLGANTELFFTLRSGNRGGQEGLTGLRTIVYGEYEVSKAVTVSLGFLRQRDIREGRPDRVGNAPLIGLDFSF